MGFNRRKMQDERKEKADSEAAARRATDGQVLEDAERLIGAWNERQARIEVTPGFDRLDDRTKVIHLLDQQLSERRVRKVQSGAKMAPEGVPGPSYEPA
jgi:hypothetical protein